MGINPLPNICIKALEAKIIYEEQVDSRQYFLGIYDDPDNQYQGEMSIDIDNKIHLLLAHHSMEKQIFFNF